jgi:tripartite-type tricarboxylate transporter receptor subunit TctC
MSLPPTLRLLVRLVVLGALIRGATAAPPAQAQEAYPTHAIHFIVPFPPGGSSDVIARLLAQKLGESLGQPLIIENHPGAAANIGHELGAKSPPDGYTLVMSNSSTLTTNVHLYKRMGFDPVSDFAPISMIGSAGQVLVV